MLDKIDDIYVKVVRPVAKFMGKSESSEWTAAMTEYREKVRLFLTNKWLQLLRVWQDQGQGKSDEAVALSAAPSKLDLIHRQCTSGVLLDLPFPTSSFIEDVAKLARKIDQGLAWVSGWFDT